MTAVAATLLRLATRGSALALAQADLAAAAVGDAAVRAGEAVRFETVVVRTRGDREATTPAAAMEGMGWFTAELEAALLDGRADLAVHSAKDLPTELAAGLAVVAHLERADPRDALVTREGVTLDELPAGAVVGTSSLRREAFLRARRPDLSIVGMRGNVDTRLRKLDEGQVDAQVLAGAGLDRIGQGRRGTVRLDPTEFVPAPAQGALAIEAVAGSAAAAAAARADHGATSACVRAERTVLRELGGGCRLALGAWARIEGGRLVLVAALAGDDGGDIRRIELAGTPDRPEQLGARVAERLRG